MKFAQAAPIPNSGSTGPIDPSNDIWAETLSGIAPLVVLIGEKNTKQVLRDVRGFHNVYSLAVAPLGLISVLTSLIRLRGSRHLRAFIGYELEARASAGLETTRINCNGVHAEVVDGYIVRNTNADPGSQAVAVTMLRGDSLQSFAEAISQVKACDDFNTQKALKDIPAEVGAVRWCIHVTSSDTDQQRAGRLVDCLSEILDIQRGGSRFATFKGEIEQLFTPEYFEYWKDARKLGGKIAQASSCLHSTRGLENGSKSISVDNTAEVLSIEAAEDPPKSSPANLLLEKQNAIAAERTPLDGASPITASEHEKPAECKSTPTLQVNFLCTFDAVSEFCTSTPVPRHLVLLLGSTMLTAILAVQFIACWQQSWKSVGWISMFVGYVGMTGGVMAAVSLIHQSCVCLEMKSQSTCGSAQWTDGLVVSAKNVDSMDTSGSNFLQSSQTTQTFEIVALKSPTWKHQFLTWIVTFESTISFIAHYLGLRSSKWWLAVCELVICLVAAFARSIAKDRQKRFQVVEGMKLDKRCTSTGIIRTQQASIVDTPLRRFDILDLRAYSGSLFEGHPLTAEHIAWHAAKICREKSPKTASNVLKLTGMLATAEHNNEQPETRAIFVSFLGGVLVTEGLAFPNIRVCIGFRARVTELGAPTPLLVRAIMRQPQWLVSHPQYGNITASLGNVYIFSINSIIDWWSLSEDRNDAHDLQKNLQWPFVLLNMAFYLALLESCVGDAQLLSGIEQAQQEASMESKGIAWAVVNFLEALRDEWMNE